MKASYFLKCNKIYIATFWSLILFALIILTLINTSQCESEWAFDNAPGIAMEYKVHIDPGKEDCYWQYVHPGATIYISMQVLKGGDGMAGMAVKNPKNEVVHAYQWKQNSEYEETATYGGYYSVCIDNQFSRFAAKLINLYITTFRYDLWEKYTKELEEVDVSVDNFTESIKKVDQKVHEMLIYQSMSRSREGRDYQLMLDNSWYIQWWSIAQCIVIVTTSTVQLYSLRRMFNDDSSRTRA